MVTNSIHLVNISCFVLEEMIPKLIDILNQCKLSLKELKMQTLYPHKIYGQLISVLIPLSSVSLEL